MEIQLLIHTSHCQGCSHPMRRVATVPDGADSQNISVIATRSVGRRCNRAGAAPAEPLAMCRVCTGNLKIQNI